MITRVAIVEEDAAARETWTRLVDLADGFVCASVSSSAEEALSTVPQVSPDVVLMDRHLPGRSALDCADQLRELLPEVPVVMVSAGTDRAGIVLGLRLARLVHRVLPEVALKHLDAVGA